MARLRTRAAAKVARAEFASSEQRDSLGTQTAAVTTAFEDTISSSDYSEYEEADDDNSSDAGSTFSLPISPLPAAVSRTLRDEPEDQLADETEKGNVDQSLQTSRKHHEVDDGRSSKHDTLSPSSDAARSVARTLPKSRAAHIRKGHTGSTARVQSERSTKKRKAATMSSSEQLDRDDNDSDRDDQLGHTQTKKSKKPRMVLKSTSTRKLPAHDPRKARSLFPKLPSASSQARGRAIPPLADGMAWCKQCTYQKPIADFRRGRGTFGKIKTTKTCNDCSKKRSNSHAKSAQNSRDVAAKVAAEDPNRKFCKVCKKSKPIAVFKWKETKNRFATVHNTCPDCALKKRTREEKRRARDKEAVAKMNTSAIAKIAEQKQCKQCNDFKHPVEFTRPNLHTTAQELVEYASCNECSETRKARDAKTYEEKHALHGPLSTDQKYCTSCTFFKPLTAFERTTLQHNPYSTREVHQVWKNCNDCQKRQQERLQGGNKAAESDDAEHQSRAFTRSEDCDSDLEDDYEEKYCSRCKFLLPLGNFERGNPSTSPSAWCNDCDRPYQRKQAALQGLLICDVCEGKFAADKEHHCHMRPCSRCPSILRHEDYAAHRAECSVALMKKREELAKIGVCNYLKRNGSRRCPEPRVDGYQLCAVHICLTRTRDSHIPHNTIIEMRRYRDIIFWNLPRAIAAFKKLASSRGASDHAKAFIEAIDELAQLRRKHPEQAVVFDIECSDTSLDLLPTNVYQVAGRDLSNNEFLVASTLDHLLPKSEHWAQQPGRNPKVGPFHFSKFYGTINDDMASTDHSGKPTATWREVQRTLIQRAEEIGGFKRVLDWSTSYLDHRAIHLGTNFADTASPLPPPPQNGLLKKSSHPLNWWMAICFFLGIKPSSRNMVPGASRPICLTLSNLYEILFPENRGLVDMAHFADADVDMTVQIINLLLDYWDGKVKPGLITEYLVREDPEPPTAEEISRAAAALERIRNKHFQAAIDVSQVDDADE